LEGEWREVGVGLAGRRSGSGKARFLSVEVHDFSHAVEYIGSVRPLLR
jgi:hypothetical protein